MPLNLSRLSKANAKAARLRWGRLNANCRAALRDYTTQLQVSVPGGDLLLIDGSWYVTHAGLLHVARRKKCVGIDAQPVSDLCNPQSSTWAFRAIAYTSKTCKGFVGYGDADPSNVSPRLRGAEMRIAETRAVNRALRKAYGIGLCSVEEIGSFSGPLPSGPTLQSKVPPAPENSSGNGNGHQLRDQLCLLIRKHRLDPTSVKAYAADFCGVTELRHAAREQVEAFVAQLSTEAETDRDALVCHLNSYAPAATQSQAEQSLAGAA